MECKNLNEYIKLTTNIIKSIKEYNYCVVKNCLIPRFDVFFCKEHREDKNNDFYKNLLKYKINSEKYKINLQDIINKNYSKKLNFKQILQQLDNIYIENQELENIISNNNNKIIGSLSCSKNNYTNNIKNFLESNYTKYDILINKIFKRVKFNNNILNHIPEYRIQNLLEQHKFDIIDLYKIMFEYDYKNQIINTNNKEIFSINLDECRKYLGSTYNKYNINDNSIICYLENIIKKDNIYGKCSEKHNVNYNEFLYKEFVKYYYKFNIVYFKNEKTFGDLFFVDKLRFDILGILINPNDTQFYYFAIEYDDSTHFNKSNKDTIWRDIIKEIYAWYNGISILRIHYLDNINNQINEFLENITVNKTCITKYSRIDPYIDRFKHLF